MVESEGIALCVVYERILQATNCVGQFSLMKTVVVAIVWPNYSLTKSMANYSYEP